MTTAPRHIAVAINPSAAFGAAGHVGPAVVAALRAAGHTVDSLCEESFEQLRAAAAGVLVGGAPSGGAASGGAPSGGAAEGGARSGGRADVLVVVGGDGMVSLGVGLVAQTGIPLGIVPSGTGNDMARGLGIPIDDTGAAIAGLVAALDRPPRVIDLGRITRADGSIRWFASVFSGGFDAAVNERANTMRWPRGRSRYTLAILWQLVRLRAIRYELVLDGVAETRDAILVAIANNESFGGGMRVAPDARLDDGLFDVVTLDPVGRMSLLRIFPRVFAGTHVLDPRVTVRRARKVTIRAADVVAYADGERVGSLPVDVEIVPRALAVLH